MAGCGFSEAYTWSLVARDPHPDALRLPVPLSADHADPAHDPRRGPRGRGAPQRAISGNERDRAVRGGAGLPASCPGERLPDERWRLGGICEGGYFRAKGAVEALHEALGIEARVRARARTSRGSIPGRRPEWTRASSASCTRRCSRAPGGSSSSISPTLFDEVPERILYEDVVTYPALRQDLAFVVPRTCSPATSSQAVREAAGGELREARVFDVYRGGQIPDGSKSVAIRVVFQSSERTLSDEDARRAPRAHRGRRRGALRRRAQGLEAGRAGDSSGRDRRLAADCVASWTPAHASAWLDPRALREPGL